MKRSVASRSPKKANSPDDPNRDGRRRSKLQPVGKDKYRRHHYPTDEEDEDDIDLFGLNDEDSADQEEG